MEHYPRQPEQQPTLIEAPHPLNAANYAQIPPLGDEFNNLQPIAPLQPTHRFPMVAVEDPERAERLTRQQKRSDELYRVAVEASSREDYLELKKPIEERFIAGDNPSEDSARIAHNIAYGAYAPKGKYAPVTPFAALKREIAKKGDGRVTAVELPDGRFVSARHLSRDTHGSELLEASRYPDAGIRRKNKRVGYVAELYMDPADAAKVPEVAARMQHRAAKESIHHQQGHLWLRREQGYIAELSGAQIRYNRELQRLFVRYVQERGNAISAFNMSHLPIRDRLPLIQEVNRAIGTSATDMHDAINRHADDVQAKIHEMNQVVYAALQQHECNAVNNAHWFIHDVAAEIQANRHRGYRWQGKMIKEGLDEILPHGEVYTNERDVLVRVALSEYLLDIARNLTHDGDTKQANEMLDYFQKIGVIHKHTRQAMSIAIDQEYMQFVVDTQLNRVIPGSSSMAYLTQDGAPQKKSNATSK